MSQPSDSIHSLDSSASIVIGQESARTMKEQLVGQKLAIKTEPMTV